MNFDPKTCPFCSGNDVRKLSSFFNDSAGCECYMSCPDCNEQWTAYINDYGECFDYVATGSDVYL